MTTPRESEKDFTRAVLDFARSRGWVVAHFSDSRRQVKPGVFVGDKDAAGFPDIVLCHPETGRLKIRELKTRTGRLTADQARWLVALGRCGVDAGVWTSADWPLIQQELG